MVINPNSQSIHQPLLEELDAQDSLLLRRDVLGVGTTNPKCALDLSNATADDAVVSYSSDRFMIFPRVSTSDRGNLTDLVGGAVIYNTTKQIRTLQWNRLGRNGNGGIVHGG